MSLSRNFNTPFDCFLKDPDVRNIFCNEYKTLNTLDLSLVILKYWKSLSENEQKPWIQKSKNYGIDIKYKTTLPSCLDLSLSQIRECLGFSRFNMDEVLSYFRGRYRNRKISKVVFLGVIKKLNKDANPLFIYKLASLIFKELSQDSQEITYCNLVIGLSVLAGGSRDEKIKQIFSHLDVNKSGYLTRHELTSYLKIVYRLFMNFDKNSNVCNISPENLAVITTTDIFSTKSSNKITYREFQNWYNY